mgnify:FL=1
MNRRYIILLGLFLVTSMGIVNALEVTKVTCEMMVDPLAVVSGQPRFGWQMKASENGAMQSAYEVEVYKLQNGQRVTVWESGKVASSQSQLVSYKGGKLQSGAKYLWRVKVWDERNKPSEWSNEGIFRLAPDTSCLDAEWIGAISHEDAKLPYGRKFHGTELKKPEVKALWAAVDTLAKKSICLRKDFIAEKQLEEAVAYVCGLGHYEFSLNGKKVGDGEFTPMRKLSIIMYMM